MRMAGRFSRRVRGFAKANGIPVIDCNSEDKKHQIAEERLRNNPTVRGLFLILVSRAVATVWEVKRSHRGVIQNLVAKWPYINYYSYDVLSTTTWFSSLVKTKKLLGFWFPSEPPVAITSTCRTAHRRQGRGGVCRGVANPCRRAPFCYPPKPTGGGAETRSLDFRWWVPEHLHDASANTKLGKSSKTHLFFKVR
jgi:hypothetical protein